MKKLAKEKIADILALTPMQEGLLFHYLKNPGSPHYFEQLSLELAGEIDVQHFQNAWNAIIETNEMLRTVFRWEKLEKPSQIILKEHKCNAIFYDLSAKDSSQRKRALDEIKNKDRRDSFDLRQVPFRVILCKLAEKEFEMVVSNHHILYDGWSNGIILKEFFNAYCALSKGEVFTPPVKPEFKAFVKRIQRQDTAKQEKFWGNYLKEFDSLPGAPAAGRRKKTRGTGDAANDRFQFPGELKNKLDSFIKSRNLTTASLLYSAWGVLLQRCHAVGDIIFDATVSGRSAGTAIKGIENIVGLFINTLPLRIQTLPGETVSSFLSRVHDMIRQWSEFENSPPLAVREILDKRRQESLFDSVAAIENYPLDSLTAADTAPLSLHSFSIVERTLYDLTVIITTLDGIELNITYNNDLFDRTIISRLFNHLVSIVEEMVTHPGKAASEIDVWAEGERETFLEHIRSVREREPEVEIEYTAPRDEVEEKLVEIWSDVLNIKKKDIGINHNFFEFGGHSLKASLLAGRIHPVFEVKVPLEEIFSRPTVRGLAGYIRETMKQQYVPMPVAVEKEYYEVSPGQGRLYMLGQLNPGSTAYNGPWSLMLDGPIDKERMEKSFKGLIRRHEMLRTSFEQRNGEPVQKIHEHVEFEIEYYDLAAKDAKGREETKVFGSPETLFQKGFWPPEAIIKSFIRPFDLSRAPLLRVGLIEVGVQRHILVVDMHHIITDGTSSAVLAGELSRLYRGEDLPALKIQYKDFSQWQNRRIAEGQLTKQEVFWLNHLSGELPVLNLPIDFPRPLMQSFAGERISFESDDVLAGRLHILMKETGTTLYMALLSVLNIVLGWYCDREDIVVGTPIAGRNHADVENTVGFFLETLAIRNQPAAGKTFAQFLQEVKGATLNAYENRDYPFSLLIKRLSPMNDLSRNPLFDVMLNVLNQRSTDFEMEGVKVIPYKLDIKVAKVDMTLEVVEQYGKINFELEYCTALFKKQTMERFVMHFLNTLRATMAAPEIRLGDIEIIDENEKRQILAGFNNTAVEYDEERTVVDYFETRAAGDPDRIAVIGSTVETLRATSLQITYRELNEQSGRWAGLLIEKGVLADDIVGIMVGPSLEMIIGIWGILKAGGAYLPIDPDYPQERIDYMLKDSGAKILLTAVECVFNYHHSSFIIHHSNHLAYLIYTSGSTGKPKGVMVRHKNLMGYIRSFQEEFKIKETDVALQQASFTFDVFVEEVYPCLLAGGTLAVPPRHVVRDTALLVKFIAAQKITIIDCSPLLLNELNGYPQAIRAGKANPLKTIRMVISGGDVLKSEYVTNLLKTGAVYNTYGPTETTVCVSYHRLTGIEGACIPIGTPITNYRVYILDGYRRLLPVGVAGEIVVGGVGVTAGYLNRPELTAEKFIDFHHSSFIIHHSNLYRTGDLGKWLPNGSIEFIGRKDRQVKIRGYRIEPGEIETRLLAHQDIKEVSVISIGEQWLCAYFTAGKEKNIKEMREFLSGDLPSYMIPAYFVQLEQMPIGPGGKIDIKALPRPGEYGLDTGVEYVLPETEIENKLVSIWQELLARERIGIMDDFFDLGGDSILVNRCIARIREEMQVEIPLRKFFQRPFIKTLAEEIEKQERQATSIKPAERVGEIPLSFAQERLWFLQELDAGNVAYFVPRVIRMKGKPDVYLLERTFTEIIRRHEILRTVFPTVDGQPVQRIQSPYRFKIPVSDWSGLEKEDREQKVSIFLKEEGRRPFDFEQGPLLRVNLLKLKEEEHLFVLTEHHLIHDGWTQGVLLNEFIRIFTAYSEGREHDLPGLAIQYADYVIWQRSYLQGERLKEHLDYWQEKLSGLIPALELPGDRPRPAVMSGEGALLEFHLPSTLTGQLEEFSRENGATLFMTMLAAFKTLLYRCTGEEDLCAGTGIANRSHKEMEGMLGMVINTLPLRTHTPGQLHFKQYLSQVKETCLEAYQRQDTPFGKIVEALSRERSLSYNPIFQVMFSFMDTPGGDLILPGLELRLEPTHNRSAKFDINIVVVPPPDENNGEILVEWEYNIDIFAAQTVERMIGHYIRLLEEVVRRPDVSISNLPMLGPEEIQRLIYEWNDTEIAYPKDKTIHELFAGQVEKAPDHIALVGATAVETLRATSLQIQITYRQLKEQSGRLAGLLIEKGVLADHIIGIMMERSIDQIIGILGILKSGGAYLPIDPAYPQERIDYMLKDSGAKLLAVANELEGKKVRRWEGEKVVLEEISILSYPLTFLPSYLLNSSNLAYVIYTSGSTGRPKGVMVEHRNVVRLVINPNYISFESPDRILQSGALEFDASTFEIWGALLNSLTLYVAAKEELLDPGRLKKAIRNYGISIMWMTSPLFNQMLQTDIEIFMGLNKLLVGGDVLSPVHIEQLRNRYPRLSVIDGYGPTENTTFSTTYLIDREHMDNIPIGKPISNSNAYIVDKYNNLQPSGVPGELYVGGDGVARGYLNRPELTAEKFIDFHHSSFIIHHSNFYRTGDLARRLPDGNIEFLGRRDFQVKIRGFRIELEEIENLLLRHESIKGAAVMVNGEGGAEKRYLIAYIVLKKEIEISILREYLKGKLPDYMTPSCFIKLEKMPLNPNGKIDRGSLPKPGLKVGEGYTAPGDEIETKLVNLWADILGRDPLHASQLQTSIGIHDNFFELGGHSLKATAMMSKIHKELEVKVELMDIFRTPTIRDIARLIRGLRKEAFQAIEPVEKKEYYPLSSAQKRLYFIQQLDLNSAGYNIPMVLPLGQGIKKDKLESTLKQLIARHESLRTSFEMLNEEVVQRIHESVEFEVEYYDLAAKNAKDREEKIKLPQLDHDSSFIIQHFIHPFDLSRAPLIRSGLITFPDGHCTWMVDIHHIVSDGTSHTILAEDFMRLYETGVPLEPLPLQYKDFAQWQNQLFAGGRVKDQEDYWLRLYAGEIPRLNLPADYKRPAVFTFEGDRRVFELEKEDAVKFKALGARCGGTLYMNMMAALNTLFYKYTGQTDIIIGSGIAGRRHADTQGVVGMFVNTLALRNFPAGEKPYENFLREVISDSVTGFENQDVQFEELVEKLDTGRDPSRNPLFDVIMAARNFRQVNLDPQWQIKNENLPGNRYKNKTSKFDLAFFISESEDDVYIELEYYTAIFKEETIERMAAHFKSVIQAVIKNPAGALKDIDILSEKEKGQLLYEFNDTGAEFPGDKTIHRLIDAQVTRTPGHAALIYKDQIITYRELDRQADRLARYLFEEKEIGIGEPVGVWMSQPVYRQVAVLGILKAGGAFVPLDPAIPPERIEYIINDARMGVVISEKHHLRDLNRLQWECAHFHSYLCIDSFDIHAEEEQEINQSMDREKLKYQDDMRAVSRHGGSWPGPGILAGNLAYIIYTSGSTGKPKGVMVEHRSLVNLCQWHNTYYAVTSWDRATKYAGFGFDASVWEFFPYLLTGAAVCITPEEIKLDIEALNRYYEKNGVTVGFLPTQVCEQFMELDNRSLRLLLTGGDKLRNYIKRNYRLYNNYGPTENTVVTTSYWVTEESGNIPIGKPIANNQVYILNSNNYLQPVGVPGELCVGGDGVARGYLNNPELTAEKFKIINYKLKIKNGSGALRADFHHSSFIIHHSKFYCTGDLARRLNDGNIEFLGRIDLQVKIRGFRIELGEIEARLLKHHFVKETVVIDRTENDETYLCAYIVFFPGEPVDPLELGSYLSGFLPGYMIPNHFIKIDRIPLTASGKVDRKALPAPRFTGQADYTAPANDVEVKLAFIWSEVLALDSEKINMESNFFQLGGHSLKATVLVSKIHKELNVKIPLAEIFTRPILRELAHYIENAAIGGCGYSSIEKVEEKEYYALSPAQKRIYILCQMAPESTAYNISGVLELHGNVDKELFEVNFKKLIDRHESFRTGFHMIAGEPVQGIHKEVEFEIEYYNLSTDDTDYTDDKDNTMHHFIRPFDLSRAPLLRIRLLKTGEAKHILMVDMSHIISDGISLGLLIKDFAALFAHEKLPGLKLRYKDYSVWQNRLLQLGEWHGQWEYWEKQFEEEIPALSLPVDFQRPLIQVFEGGAVGFETGAGETTALKRIASERGMTPYMMILSLYYVFLSKVSGQEDIVVGTPVAGRTHAELECIIGMFVNTLALRNYPTAGKTFDDFLAEIKQRTLEAFGNQDFPFDALVERLGVAGDLSRNPLFDVMFVMQNMEIPEIRVPGLIFAPYPTENRVSQFDLTLSAVEEGDKIHFSFTYCSKLFKEETVRRFTGYLKKIISAVLESPRTRIAEIEIISDEEKKHILNNFNDTSYPYPGDKTIQQLFAEQVERTPDRIAVIGSTVETLRATSLQITYRQLNNQSDRMAGLLIEKGVLADNIIGIMMERSIDMIIGIFGILKSGGAYLPIAPDYPQERIDYMLKDSGAKILLTAAECVFNFHHSSFILKGCPRRGLHHSNLAYVIYTSGSTGKPKGVAVEHHSVINRLNWMQRAYPIGEKDRILQKTPVVFDVSVWELFWWSFYGAQLYLLKPGEEKDAGAIIEAINNNRITTLHFVPSMLAVFLDYLETGGDTGKSKSLRRVFSSGEALTLPQVENFNRLLNRNNGTLLINLYGPTEATVDVSYFNCPTGEIPGNIPIGKPIDNIQLYIVDKDMHLQPVGIPGELCIGGAGLAGGYLNRPELTAEKFIKSFSGGAGGRFYKKAPLLYRTGDLARRLNDGNIEFLGRIDFQVKVRGYRIEPGEIENFLRRCDGINEAIVSARADKNGENYLCAYIVPVDNNGAPPDIDGIRDYLSRVLPAYMIPAYIVKIEKAPLTPNGKLDRRALPLPEPASTGGGIYTAPRTPVEEELAAIWTEILGGDALPESPLPTSIGIDDNFFHLGGHSINAAALAGRIHKKFQAKMTLAEIFQRPTIRQLAQYIEGKTKEFFYSIMPTAPKPYYAVSSAQKRLYITHQMNPGGTQCNMPHAFTLEGELDMAALEQAFTRLIQRHETLRTGFEMRDNLPVQVIHPRVEFKIEDCGDNASPRQIIRNFVRPFELSSPPLLRIGVAKIAENKRLMIVDMHHIISDGVSFNIIQEEFIALYAGEELSPLKLQYKDFSEWQNRLFAGAEIQTQADYWLKEFSEGAPALDLPVDYPRPPASDKAGETVCFQVERELTRQIKKLNVETETTPYMVLLAALYILLHRYSGRRDIVVGAVAAGRSHSDLDHIIGVFINMLPIRNKIQEELSFGEFLEQVKTKALNAYENQDFQYDELVNRLGIKARYGKSPLFDVHFTLQDAMEYTEKKKPGKNTGPVMKLYPFREVELGWELDFAAIETDDAIFFTLDYLVALFKKTTAEKIGNHFVEILEQCLGNTGIKIKDIVISLDLARGKIDMSAEEVANFEF
ncbi:MAG: amino acid adenylation domain-containing protein [Candidatus Aminicenantes bacterium]|nr:amino acid adenylation domain-containing protein [Candidatus Aminicenantes bacterium]